MIEILQWVSITTGGILIILMLLSIIGGLDFDLDIGDTDVDAETGSGGGIGVIKGALTFVSVTSWVIKLLLATNENLFLAIGIGIFAGLAALSLLNWLFKTLLKNEENVNWSMDDALFQQGKVYLRIPSGNGNGIVHVEIKGVSRELKAKTLHQHEISTGSNIVVTDVESDFVYVEPLKRNEF